VFLQLKTNIRLTECLKSPSQNRKGTHLEKNSKYLLKSV